MEETTTIENSGLHLTDASKSFLREATKWSYFLSIVGFVFIGFIVLVALFAGTIFSRIGQMGGEAGAFGAIGGTFITILYLIIALVYFFPVYYLYKFSAEAKIAFRDNDNESLTSSFEYLKSHYKFVGILTLITLSFYALMIVFFLLAGLAAIA